jgi:hypothetical protein
MAAATSTATQPGKPPSSAFPLDSSRLLQISGFPRAHLLVTRNQFGEVTKGAKADLGEEGCFHGGIVFITQRKEVFSRKVKRRKSKKTYRNVFKEVYIWGRDVGKEVYIWPRTKVRTS